MFVPARQWLHRLAELIPWNRILDSSKVENSGSGEGQTRKNIQQSANVNVGFAQYPQFVRPQREEGISEGKGRYSLYCIKGFVNGRLLLWG